MHAIIQAQGAKAFKHDDFMLGKLSHEVVAERDGMVVGIDNLQIAKIARLAGAPKVPNAGVDVAHKLGDRVKRGDTLYTIYAEFPSDLLFAMQQCEKTSGYTIGDETEIPHSYLEY
jgi:thymidine phosphorylase